LSNDEINELISNKYDDIVFNSKLNEFDIYKTRYYLGEIYIDINDYLSNIDNDF
jgi:hypothetical protein